jgi:hypothetical protein
MELLGGVMLVRTNRLNLVLFLASIAIGIVLVGVALQGSIALQRARNVSGAGFMKPNIL